MELPTPDSFAELLRTFAGFYVKNPDKLGVRHQAAIDGAVYFGMQGAPEDDSRLVGKGGCHVNALMFLVEQVGKRQSREYTFRLITRKDGVEHWSEPRDALDYDPRPLRDFLCRWLEALVVPDFAVTISPGDGPRRNLSFKFEVELENRFLARDLTTEKPLVIRKGREGEPDKVVMLSIVGALGTLFRAIAKQNGIRAEVRLKQ